MSPLAYTGAELNSFIAPAADYEVKAEWSVSTVGSPAHSHTLIDVDWQVETSFTFTPIPEPSSMFLVIFGLIGLSTYRRSIRHRARGSG